MWYELIPAEKNIDSRKVFARDLRELHELVAIFCEETDADAFGLDCVSEGERAAEYAQDLDFDLSR